ncbi:hypothetical protein ES708_17510 [subsurface metagenome]
MKPKERLLTAISHKEPDLIPIDWGNWEFGHLGGCLAKPFETPRERTPSNLCV